jgi:hypothetical protein
MSDLLTSFRPREELKLWACTEMHEELPAAEYVVRHCAHFILMWLAIAAAGTPVTIEKLQEVWASVGRKVAAGWGRHADSDDKHGFLLAATKQLKNSKLAALRTMEDFFDSTFTTTNQHALK